jgi:hypothetical protein
MSFGGPAPTTTVASGPFEDTMNKLASSPYAIAAGIFVLNIGGRMLPMELTRGQEEFLNQSWFRRIVIFMIFFVATRNLITAFWISFVIILCAGYLFNENSQFYLFAKAGLKPADAKLPALTAEENYMLRSLMAKADKIKAASGTPIVLAAKPVTHDKYQKVIQSLMAQ